MREVQVKQPAGPVYYQAQEMFGTVVTEDDWPNVIKLSRKTRLKKLSRAESEKIAALLYGKEPRHA